MTPLLWLFHYLDDDSVVYGNLGVFQSGAVHVHRFCVL